MICALNVQVIGPRRDLELGRRLRLDLGAGQADVDAQQAATERQFHALADLVRLVLAATCQTNALSVYS